MKVPSTTPPPDFITILNEALKEYCSAIDKARMLKTIPVPIRFKACGFSANIFIEEDTIKISIREKGD